LGLTSPYPYLEGPGAQVRAEAVAAAQEKLAATRRALDKRREELRGLERQARRAPPEARCMGCMRRNLLGSSSRAALRARRAAPRPGLMGGLQRAKGL
jgi:hypothetical protein